MQGPPGTLPGLHNLPPQLGQYWFVPDVGQDAKVDATRSEWVYAQNMNLQVGDLDINSPKCRCDDLLLTPNHLRLAMFSKINLLLSGSSSCRYPWKG
jgi:hypothetical protein